MVIFPSYAELHHFVEELIEFLSNNQYQSRVKLIILEDVKFARSTELAKQQGENRLLQDFIGKMDFNGIKKDNWGKDAFFAYELETRLTLFFITQWV